MTVLVSGASGLLGTALVAGLRQDRLRVVRLVRHTPNQDDQRQWDPYATSLPDGFLDGIDTLVHLSGENIAAGRWTTARRKRAIRELIRCG